jgi:hypothetical protein
MIDFKKYPDFESSLKSNHLQMRSFLNEIGFDSGAYIIIDRITVNMFSNPINLKIADCTKTITLSFSEDINEIENSRKKIKKLKHALEIIENLLENTSPLPRS